MILASSSETGLAGGVSITLIVIMAVLFACGVYAMLERSLTRVLIGFLLLGNAANLLLLIVMGAPGIAPFYDGAESTAGMSDPLPQALTLTAIVITFAVSAFLLALIYRSWQLGQADTFDDDETDMTLRAQAAEVDELEEEGEDEDDDITTDFVGSVASPLTVLHHRDFAALRDDAPMDVAGRPVPAGADALTTEGPRVDSVDRATEINAGDTIDDTAATDEASAPDTEDHESTSQRTGTREESPTEQGPTSEAPQGEPAADDEPLPDDPPTGERPKAADATADDGSGDAHEPGHRPDTPASDTDEPEGGARA